MTLEEHLGAIGTIVAKLRGHVVIGTDYLRDGMRIAETDADGMLSLLAALGQSQRRRIVALVSDETAAIALAETKRSAAFI